MYEELDIQIAKIKQEIEQTQKKQTKIEQHHENNIQDLSIIIENKKIDFEKRTILNDKIEMYLPKLFAIMSPQQAKLKYPSEYRPAYILTNPDASINLTFTHDSAKAHNEDIPRARDMILLSTKKLNPSIELLENKELKAGEKSVFYFSFFSPALDGIIYNLMFFLNLNDHLLFGNFNCRKPDYYDWEPIAKQMIASIRKKDQTIKASL